MYREKEPIFIDDYTISIDEFNEEEEDSNE